MKMNPIFYVYIWLATIPMACIPRTAEAYIGPGAGLTAIGTLVAFIFAVAIAIIGFIWYPLKRLLVKLRDKR